MCELLIWGSSLVLVRFVMNTIDLSIRKVNWRDRLVNLGLEFEYCGHLRPVYSEVSYERRLECATFWDSRAIGWDLGAEVNKHCSAYCRRLR